MSEGVLVICPFGGGGELLAMNLAAELENYQIGNRVGFAYPYLPEYKKGDPALLQQAAAVVRDGLVAGVSEFMFVDTAIRPVLNQINEMLPVDSRPIIYDIYDETRMYYHDPQERPIWLDRWEVSEKIEGFDTLYSLDQENLKELTEEVIWRARGVTGGNTENVPEKWQKDLAEENILRTRAAQLTFKLVEIVGEKGFLLVNVDLAIALTRYIDEEFREYMKACRYTTLAKVLAARLV